MQYTKPLTSPGPPQVFDSGCIGEGVLHILAAAQARLLGPGAAVVPAAARVFCQPIQLRTSTVLGWDCSQANRWRWRPDYEGLELGKCRWAGQLARKGGLLWGGGHEVGEGVWDGRVRTRDRCPGCSYAAPKGF